MTSRSLSAGLSELESLIKTNPENVLWSGPSDRNTFQELINIPLRLPAGGRYQFTAKGSTLVVASIGDREISSFGFAAEVAGRVTTELTEEGARISNFGSSRFDTLLILKRRAPVDSTAIAAANTIYPLTLLDEYADLRDEARQRGLTPTQRNRRDQIVRELGSEIGRASRSESYPSYRSTPSNIGSESRGGSSSSTPG